MMAEKSKVLFRIDHGGRYTMRRHNIRQDSATSPMYEEIGAALESRLILDNDEDVNCSIAGSEFLVSRGSNHIDAAWGTVNKGRRRG